MRTGFYILKFIYVNIFMFYCKKNQECSQSAMHSRIFTILFSFNE